MLGHARLDTTRAYVRVVNAPKENPALKLGVRV